MNATAKTILTIVVSTSVLAIIGYFFGFPMMFAHSAMEIFYYAGYFLAGNLLTLGGLWLFQKPKVKAVTKTQTQVTEQVATAA